MKTIICGILLVLFCFTFSALLGEDAAPVPPYVAAPLASDLDGLSGNEIAALYHLVKAAAVMDRLFFRQAWSGNPQALREMEKYSGTDKERLSDYFLINFGPFDRLAENKSFFGTAVKPLGAAFYPDDMGREEFENFLKANPQKRLGFESPYTVIGRGPAGLLAIPYHEYYKDTLKECSAELAKAAAGTGNASLQKYLLSRAAALGSDDYFQSDCDWLDITASRLETVIGPYEVYEDSLFNYKAAYEAFVYLNDMKESGRVQSFIAYLPLMQQNLPVDKKYLAEKLAALSPLQIADLVFSAGDAKAGVNTIAFALPNDEKVRELKGSKKIILKNVIAAKYDKILLPIARLLIAPEQQPMVNAKAFLYHTILHELAHPLGTDYIDPQKDRIPVRKSLKETYSLNEEAKADTVGLYNSLLMMKKGVIEPGMQNAMFVTQLASMFRAMRFGTEEAHGGANLVQFNYLKEKGGIVEKGGRYSVDFGKFTTALTALVKEILEIQGRGDYARSKAFNEKYGKVDPVLRDHLRQLQAIPVDIKPEFGTLRELARRFNDSTLNQDRFLK